jgi:MFS family permease
MMVKVYALFAVVGFIGVAIVVFGGALADNLGRTERDPQRAIGEAGRLSLGAVLGFGIGGLAAEFSPLDLSWQIALLLALVGSGLGVVWVRYAGATLRG